MQSAEPEPDLASSRMKGLSLRTRILIVVPILAVVVGSVIVKHVVARSRVDAAEKELALELSRIRAKGEPTTPDKLTPAPVPDEENAAVVFERAFAKINLGDPGVEGWKECLEGSFEAHREKAERVLELNGEALRLARQAVLRPYCRFDLDYAKGYGLELPHLAHLRDLTRLFAVEALLCVRARRIADAADSTCHVFRLAHAMDDEPVLVSKLIQTVVVRIGLDVLKEVEASSEITDEDRRELISSMVRLDFGRAMIEGMVGERTAALSVMERTIAGKTPWPGASSEDKVPAKGLTRVVLLKDMAFVLRCETDLITRLRRNPCGATSPALDRTQARPTAESAERAGPFAGLLLTGLASTLTRFVETWARRDAAVIGLSCELHRSAHGRYPDTLDALVPEFRAELSPDPFTGKPFIYRKRADGAGFIVYSVGENLTDDGGVSDRDAEKDDIPWERGSPRGE